MQPLLPRPSSLRRLLLPALAGLVGTPPMVRAEDNPAASGDEVVQMSDFTVQSSRDYGYRATNSLTATGMATKISDVPVSIGVMTDEFIKDQAGFRLVDVMNTMAGVNDQGAEQNANNITVRGFQTTPQRDGFAGIAGANESTVGVDRVEVIKGPASVFNGLIAPGGVVNVVYKKPAFTPSAYVEATAGSFDFGSAEVSSTGPLIDHKLAYLVDGYLKNNNAWRDWVGNNEKTGIFGLTYTPFEAVNLTLNYRRYDLSDQVGAFLPRIHTGYKSAGLAWNANPVTWAATAFGPNEPAFNLVSAATDYPGGYRYNINGPQNFRNTRITEFNPELTIKLNGHFDFRNGFMYSHLDRETLGAGAAPNGGSPLNDGSSASVVPSYTSSDLVVKIDKSELATHFDTGPVSHSLLIGYSYTKTETMQNIGSYRAPARDWNFFTGPQMILDELNVVYPNQQYRVKGGPFDVEIAAAYIAEQMSAWDGRVRVLLGDRETTQKTWTYLAPIPVKVKQATPQAGLMIRPFPKESVLKDLGIFANYSKSFEPSGLIDSAGQIIPAATGSGKEAGFKLDSPQGAVSTTVSYFSEERSNIAQEDFIKEAALGGKYYNLGGAQLVRGGEVDTIWTFSRNFQVDANYTYLPTAKTTAMAAVPNEVGVRFPIVPVHRGNLNGKYTFTTGPLRKFYLGGGLVAQSKIRANSDATWMFNIWAPAFVEFNAFGGYSTKIFSRNVNLSLNIKNLFDRRGFSWDVATPNEPIRAYFTTRVSL